MIYALMEDAIQEQSVESVMPDGMRTYVGVADYDELDALVQKLGLRSDFLRDCQRSGVPSHESCEGYDFLTLQIPDDTDQRKPPKRVCIYLSGHLLLFVCHKDTVVREVMDELRGIGMKSISLGRILHLYLDKLTGDDAIVLERIEQEVTDMEEKLMSSTQSGMPNEIIALRRKLLSLKRYYEQLLEITEEIEQNENGFIDKKAMRYLSMITRRVDRLYHSVLNLRDYVTQVRESYQAQIDIDLNKIMKLFTVITSVFLPLTLIVGWYGMNLRMPEFNWTYGYAFVIGLCVVVAGSTLIYFKKHKWF